MNPTLTQLLDDCAGRYPAEEEQRRVLDYATTLPNRFRASDALRAAEDGIIERTLSELRERHTEYFEKSPRVTGELLPDDLRQGLRYAALAMIREDLSLQEDRLLAWMRSVRSQLNVPSEFVRDAYSTLRDRVRDALDDEAFGLLEPYLIVNVESLGRVSV